jgi:hypothetical protein
MIIKIVAVSVSFGDKIERGFWTKTCNRSATHRKTDMRYLPQHLHTIA